MKNSGILKRLRYMFFFALAGVFCFSCGLETVIYINPPTQVYNDILYSNDEYLKWYFSFCTEEQSNNSSDTNFTGTGIYYRIYNNSDNLESERNTINNLNTSTNGSASSVKMLNLSYQPLYFRPESFPAKPDSKSFSVSNANSNRNVVFRLKTYTGNEGVADSQLETFRSCIKVNNYYWGFADGSTVLSRDITYDEESGKWESGGSLYENSLIDFAVPCRSNGKSFDFFNDAEITDSEYNVEPSEGDDDYNHNESASSANTYFVQLYAVGIAFDQENLSDAYSAVLDLGSVPIIKGK